MAHMAFIKCLASFQIQHVLMTSDLSGGDSQLEIAINFAYNYALGPNSGIVRTNGYFVGEKLRARTEERRGKKGQ